MRHRCSATVGMACMLAHCTAVRLQAETGAAAAVAAQPGASGHQAGCTTDIQLVFWTLQSNTATQHSRRTIAQPLPAHLSPGCWPPQQPARPRPLAARPLGLLPPSAGCRLCWKQAAAAHLDRQPHARQGRRAAAGCAAAACPFPWPGVGEARVDDWDRLEGRLGARARPVAVLARAPGATGWEYGLYGAVLPLGSFTLGEGLTRRSPGLGASFIRTGLMESSPGMACGRGMPSWKWYACRADALRLWASARTAF